MVEVELACLALALLASHGGRDHIDLDDYGDRDVRNPLVPVAKGPVVDARGCKH
jgi:hypothetical protein